MGRETGRCRQGFILLCIVAEGVLFKRPACLLGLGKNQRRRPCAKHTGCFSALT